MIGRLFIDGEDAYVTYGVVVCQGGYDRLVEFPKPKKYTTTDWHEEDGIEIDGGIMYFECRSFAINFMCKGDESNFNSFVIKLSDGVLHTFNFAAISLTCNLRYVSCSNFKQGMNFSTFTLTFALDEDVFANYVYSDPTMSLYGDSDNYFNFGHFRQFGLSLLGNYKNELLKATSAKKSLELSEQYDNGVVYDYSDVVRFSQRKSRLQFLIQAENWSDLWSRWKALLYNFSFPGKIHLLTIASMPNYQFTVCYESMNVEQLMANGRRVVVKFNVELLTEYTVSDVPITALWTESDEIFSTEEGSLIEITL